MKRLLLAVAALSFLTACGSPEETASDSDAGSDASNGAELGFEDAMVEETVPAVPTCGPDGPSALYAVYQLRFAVEDVPGLASGFDIDGHTTRPGDGTGCGRPDFTSPDGQAGIDNQFARLVPTLANTLGEDPNGSLDRAVEEAEMILLLEIEGLDDPREDECVNVNLYRATDDVVFGADGFLLEGQSYDIDLDRPWARVEGASVSGGELFARGFRLELPMTFFSTDVFLVLADTWLSLPVDAADVDGTLGGAITVADFLETVRSIDDGFGDVASLLLTNNADLSSDGVAECDAISIAWSIRARAGHLYPDTVRP